MAAPSNDAEQGDGGARVGLAASRRTDEVGVVPGRRWTGTGVPGRYARGRLARHGTVARLCYGESGKTMADGGKAGGGPRLWNGARRGWSRRFRDWSVTAGPDRAPDGSGLSGVQRPGACRYASGGSTRYIPGSSVSPDLYKRPSRIGRARARAQTVLSRGRGSMNRIPYLKGDSHQMASWHGGAGLGEDSVVKPHTLAPLGASPVRGYQLA